MDAIAFSLLWFDIYWYGIMYSISFVVWYLFFILLPYLTWFSRLSNSTKKAYTHYLDDIFIAIMLGVLIWWRLWHVFIYNFWYYIDNLWEIFAFQQWWMSFIGGIVWVVILVSIYLSWIRSYSLYEIMWVFDIIIVMVPFGILVWRIGNFINQELYGVPVLKN